MSVFGKSLRDLSTPWKWALSILVIALLLGLTIQLILSLFIDDSLEKYLEEKVHNTTQGRYQLHIDDLDLNLPGKEVVVKNLTLLPDSISSGLTGKHSVPYPIRGTFQIEALTISGISLWKYLINDELAIDSIVLDHPRLSAMQLRNKSPDSNNQSSSLDSTLFAIISKQFSAFRLDNLVLRNAGFNLRKQSNGQQIASLQKLSLHLRDILVDSASVNSDRLFITDDIELDASGYTMDFMQGFYTLKLSKLQLSSNNQKIGVDSLQLIPQLPRYEFSEAYGRQIDRIDLLISAIKFDQLDFGQLTNSGRLYATALTVADAKLNVFHDMNASFDSTRYPPLPQTAFRNLDMPVNIKNIRITDSHISYTEHQKGVPKAGTVIFDELQASIDSLSNYREDLKNGHQTTVETQTRVMGEGLLNVYFTFQMGSPQGRHSIYGTMDTTAFSQFNPALQNLAFIRIDQGTINSMEFTMDLNNEQARGTVTLAYEDLEIEMLKSETLNQGVGQEVKSFIANTFVVQENNQRPLRQGEISFERNEQKSVFNYWWKSLSTGLKNSIGL